MKDFEYDVDRANELVDKAVADDAIKIVSFTSTKSCRAVLEETQHDGNTILEQDTLYDIEEASILIERDKEPIIANVTNVGKSAESDGNVENFEQKFMFCFLFFVFGLFFHLTSLVPTKPNDLRADKQEL